MITELRQTPDESFGKRPPALCSNIDLQNRDKSPMNPSLNYEFRDRLQIFTEQIYRFTEWIYRYLQNRFIDIYRIDLQIFTEWIYRIDLQNRLRQKPDSCLVQDKRIIPSVNFVYEFRDHITAPVPARHFAVILQIFTEQIYRMESKALQNPSDNFRDHGTLLLFIDLQNGEPDESAETALFRDNFSRIHSPDCIV